MQTTKSNKAKLMPAIHFPGNCDEAIKFHKGIGTEECEGGGK